jgi:uncharacterized membrane protein
VQQRTPLALTIAASLWTAALVAAPAALSHSTLAVPAAAVYAGAARVCHQKPERSFHLAGVQLPVCGRCFGLYLSGALGTIAAWASRRRPRGPVRMALMVAAVPTAATWSIEMAGLSGFSMFVQMLRYDSSLDAHKVHDSRSHVHGR